MCESSLRLNSVFCLPSSYSPLRMVCSNRVRPFSTRLTGQLGFPISGLLSCLCFGIVTLANMTCRLGSSPACPEIWSWKDLEGLRIWVLDFLPEGRVELGSKIPHPIPQAKWHFHRCSRCANTGWSPFRLLSFHFRALLRTVRLPHLWLEVGPPWALTRR